MVYKQGLHSDQQLSAAALCFETRVSKGVFELESFKIRFQLIVLSNICHLDVCLASAAAAAAGKMLLVEATAHSAGWLVGWLAN
jgi:hypothetical protein